MLRIGRNKFYDRKNEIPMKILEFKRSRTGIIIEFRRICRILRNSERIFQPRAAALAFHGSHCGWHRAKLGGGAAALASLALLGCSHQRWWVLGIVHWRGMSGRQWWRIGGTIAFSQCWRQHAGVRRGGTQQSP
jgi:hypothetical protein